MSNPSQFRLPKDSKAWQNAVDAIADLLPDNTNLRDFEALQSLPVFALIVVLPAPIPDLDIHRYIQSWVDDQPNWHLVTVAEDKDANYVHFNIDHNDIEAVHVAEAALEAGNFSQSDNDSLENSTLKNNKANLDKNLSANPAKSFVAAHVFRYLLVPVTKTLMHPAKKTAAAHIIDDQLTSSLRQDLREHYQQDQADPLEALNVVDCHILSISPMLRTHKLVCFDMDSTLIEQEVIVELAKKAGVGDEVAEITESAMRGEIEFDESFARRLALLKGVSTSVLDDICANLTLSTGAKATISAFKALGYHTVLVSGGFTYFARYIADILGIDEVHANRLDISDGKVTGEVQLPIINGAKKAAIAAQTAARLGIDMSQVVCVGDGANDLPMMMAADLGVAYRAKPIVQARADAAVNVTGVEGVLYALGYPELLQDD
ncbi:MULTISPECIES: phosphoserine phosphatase SerB [Psychrobacter]|uniref:phosphoserine phosphatase SerB n=1 Tax=Psychrobacter TaxID=497 RepID=UPI00146D2AE0|nr:MULTISPECIES: phosphoserine phosphatase SerB [Psychrobacter]